MGKAGAIACKGHIHRTGHTKQILLNSMGLAYAHTVHIGYCTSDTLPRFLLLQKASSESPKDHFSLQADICDGLHSSAVTDALSLDVRNKRSCPSRASIQEKNTNTPPLPNRPVCSPSWVK